LPINSRARTERDGRSWPRMAPKIMKITSAIVLKMVVTTESVNGLKFESKEPRTYVTIKKASPVIVKVHRPKGASKVGDKSAIRPERNPIRTAEDRSSLSIQAIAKAK